MSLYSYIPFSIQFFQTELKKLQFLFLKTLLNDNDQTDTNVSSRILFCRQFQSFTQENMIYWRVCIFLIILFC
jgi:hypothetical protein